MISVKHRRSIALALLTVAVHVLGVVVLVPKIDAAGVGVIKPPSEMQASLIASPPPPPMPAPAPPPPVLRPPPLPDIPPVPAIVSASEVEAPQLAELPVETSVAAKLADVGTVAVAPPPPVAAAEPETKPPPATPPGPEALTGKAYRTDVPPSSRILLAVARKDADGRLWHGEAAMAWQLDGGQYRMKLEAGIRVLVTRVNLVVLESTGNVGAAGFVPKTMTEKRRGRAQTATTFGAEGDKITFTASPASYAIAPGTQDKATVPLQLAAIARADSSQLKGNIDMLVGEDKDASVFRFVLVGQEEIDTPLGRLLTWHLSRSPRPGAYNSRLDVWLAPSLGWVPVRIDNIESSGATTTQTVKNISRPDAG